MKTNCEGRKEEGRAKKSRDLHSQRSSSKSYEWSTYIHTNGHIQNNNCHLIYIVYLQPQIISSASTFMCSETIIKEKNITQYTYDVINS